MCVETNPASAEQAAAYHQWYNDTHLQECVGVEGFVSARRFAPVGHEGAFLAIYEIDADDIDAVRDRLTAFLRSSDSSTPVGVQMNPPPAVRFYEEIGGYQPDG
jgi:hypothetical protein